ncbi:MAG: response regulator [Holophagales bacterium]|nr:response regulator [Holophagales bacterium]
MAHCSSAPRRTGFRGRLFPPDSPPAARLMRTEAGAGRALVEALRDRLSRLSEASLRINDSPDLKTVLREVLETASALTGARCAGITTFDASGTLEDIVTRGLGPKDHQWFAEMPQGQGKNLFRYFRRVDGQPFRQANMSAHLRSLGFPYESFAVETLLMTPIRHQGVRLGTFYLADKQTQPEFTDDDEEVATLLSSQAGAAIVNARRHRDELRTRADLETLIDMSPVAVVVFDGRTGKVKSRNRETDRMAGLLHRPGTSLDELLSTVSARRADGREIARDEVAQALSDARPTRAEEIVLRSPGGESLTVLVNVAPIHGEDGAVESVLVTMQDMTPLEDLERLRAEFMGLVSHELRAPLTAIKGSAASALAASPIPDPAETEQYFRIIDEHADHMRGLISDLLDVTRIETGTLSVAARAEDLAAIVDQARNTFLSGGGRHPVRIDLPPDLPRVVADRQRLVQILGNLLDNAARHSPETSPIRLSAASEGTHVAISVTDQGKGIAAERLPHLFRKFARSGREESARRLGAGLGLAICKGLIEAHGGRIRADSDGPDLGARFTFTIPAIEAANGTAGAGSGRKSPRRRPGSRRRSVLVVDDDPQALTYARRILDGAAYRPLLAGNTAELHDLLQKEQPDVVLLDLVLPGTDGIELMKTVPALADRPVIFVSGYGRDETIARALEAGAADYIVKPFSPTELLARIQVALRSRAAPAEPYRAGDLVVDDERRRVTVAGRDVPLTATEYNLLRTLARNAGRVSTHDYLLRRVWGWDHSGDTRPLRAFIKKLRRKLGDDAKAPLYIFTEPRVGYRMAEAE